MKKTILVGVFILALAVVGYARDFPRGKPFKGLLDLIRSLDNRVTALESSGGGGGGGGGVIESLGLAFQGEVVYSASGASREFQEGPTQIPIPSDGQLLSLAINPFSNSLDGLAVITVRLNGQDTTLQIDVPPKSMVVEIFDSTVDC